MIFTSLQTQHAAFVKIVHISYNVPRPAFYDPEVWLKKIRFSSIILEHMANHAEVVAIYHIQYRGELNKNGVTNLFPGFTRWQLLLPFAFNRCIKKLSPQVVVVHGLISPWQVVMLRSVLGSHVKIIAQHHAERPLRSARAFFQRWADRYITAYLFTSLDLAKDWRDRGLIRDLNKVKEVMEASSPFYPMPIDEARKITRAQGSMTFIWVGGLTSRKNPPLVIRAFSAFVQTQPQAKLYMIFQSRELFPEVERLVAGCSSITLLGEVANDELLYWYNSVQYVVASSFYEGSGIAVCEAMSCGCIPILTNIPSFRMMTGEAKVGLLYEPGDEAGLLAALHNTLKLDAVKEKEKVLQQFRQELSFEAIADKTIDVIKSIL